MADALQRLMAQLGGGADALIVGTPETAVSVIDAAAANLAAQGTVIPVTAPDIELTLSSLIAQISGCTDLGGQDDAVLELGFNRLTGPGRTFLLLSAPVGISRSALRYLQHILRQAPRLGLVVLESAPLDTMLDGPDFAALRLRLRADPPIGVRSESPPLPSKALVPILAPAAVSIPSGRRRSLVWVASIVGVAALGCIAWVGQGATGAASDGRHSSIVHLPLETAQVPLAPLGRSDPPSLATIAPSTLTRPAPSPGPYDAVAVPILAMASPPPPAQPQHPGLGDPISLPLLTPPSPTPLAHRPFAARRDVVRAARPHLRWQPPQIEDPAHDAWASPYGSPPPPWPRPELDRRMTPYGPNAIDAYGRTMFGYSP